MRLSESACVLQLGDGSFSCLNLGQSTGRLVKCVLSLGIRNGDEVVVVVVLVAASSSSGRVLTQGEMSRRERVFSFLFDGDDTCSSGKVHGSQGVVVNLNSLGQRLGVPAVALAGHMAAFAAVMFFVH